jgi:hypothetical protein
LESGEVVGDGQPEARSATGALSGGVGSVEAFEDVGEMLRRNATTSIRNGRLDPTIVRTADDGNSSSGRSKTHGIVEKGRQNLTGPPRITKGWEFAGYFNVEQYLFLCGPQNEAIGCLGEDLRKIEGLVREVELAGIEAGQDEQIRDQRVHSVDLGELVLDHLAVSRGRRLPRNHLRIDLNKCDWRFQFVRCVGYERALPVEGASDWPHGPAGYE